MNKIKNIALFPLNICLLPGEDLPVKIFEPRYKQLINDCELEHFTFGIPYMLNNKMQNYGTEVKLNQIVASNSHGEMVIMVEGVSNFELLRFEDSFNAKLYSGGSIEVLDLCSEFKDKELLKQIIHYSETMDKDFLSDIKPQNLNAIDVAKILNLSSSDKFKFISMKSQQEKENFIRYNLDCLYKLREQENLLNKDYSLN